MCCKDVTLGRGTEESSRAWPQGEDVFPRLHMSPLGKSQPELMRALVSGGIPPHGPVVLRSTDPMHLGETGHL